MKTCSRCNQTKAIADYYRGKGKDGLQPYCRICSNAYKMAARRRDLPGYNRQQRERRANDPAFREAQRRAGRAYYHRNKAVCDAKRKAWRIAHPEQAKMLNLRSKYGLTLGAWQDIRARQNNQCAICKNTLRPGKATHVDHDHTCCPGKKSCGQCVRGLLCGNCNRMLGCAQDNDKILKAGAHYLRAHLTPCKVGDIYGD